jgi:hypothetical protein
MFVVAQCLILTAFTTIITCRINTTVNMVVSQSIYVGYALWAHQSFYLSGWVNRLRTLLAMVLSILCFFAAIMVIFLMTVIFSIVWKKSFGGEVIACL